MTDLLERYLQAIGQFLPAAAKEDTLAELRANLLEQMDARGEELGRPLTAGDVAAILKQHGKPELVALRYLPQRSLIGPAIYPFYKFTLLRVLPLVIFAYAIAKGVVLVTGPSREQAMHQLVGFAFGLIPTLLTFWASMTMVFALIERMRERGRLGETWNQWDPAKLPAVRSQQDVEPKSMAKRVASLAAHCLWMAYILWIPWHPFWLLGPGVLYMDGLSVTLAPVWHTFYAVLIALLTVQLAMKLLAFVPAAEGWQKPLKLVTGVLGAATVGFLAFAPVYFLPANAAANLAKIASVNHSLGLAFRIVFLISLVGLVKEGWRYVKHMAPTERLAF